MADSTMRGMRLGASSLESERNVTYEQRVKHSYQCTQGHISEVTFFVDAEVPQSWECKTCSREAVLLIDGVKVDLEHADAKTPRSHWEMLLERRTVEELQVLLDEQLVNLRVRREAAAANARKAS